MSTVVAAAPEVAWVGRVLELVGGHLGEGLRDAEARHAFTLLQSARVPSIRDESWRFTPLGRLWALAPTVGAGAPEVLLARLSRYLIPEAAGRRLVFVDGVFQAGLSDWVGVDPGVTFLPLHAASDDTLGAHFGTALGDRTEFFTALALAARQDGVCLRVPRDCVAAGPYQILYVQTGAQNGLLTAPRTFMEVGSHADVVVSQSFVALDEGEYIHNEVTEACVGAGGRLQHIRIQSDSRAAVHVGRSAVAIAQDGQYALSSVTLGGAISRFVPHVVQGGTGISVLMSGLTLLGGSQVADTHSVMDHASPHGHSAQLNKCIVSDQARAVFNGQVVVRPGAQLTDSAQSSRSLLLSPKASVDTKPELEIYADDVKCSHGAAIGQLDEESLFYLASRGIPESNARDLLTYAFAAEVLESIPVASLRERMQQVVLHRTDRTRRES